jgi:hypothetical protein
VRLTRRTVGCALIVVGATGFGSSVVGAGGAAAQEGRSSSRFIGTASADGVRMSYDVPNFVLTDRLADGGAPVAQAMVSSTESVGFASAPYPGDAVVSSTGLAAGATGAPIPQYPLVATSEYPAREEASVEQGVVSMSANSTASSSSARSAAGGPDDDAASLGSALATAEVVHDEEVGTVTSTATSEAEVFTVADVFRIGRIASLAKVVDEPDGDPQREFSLEIGEVTIAGQTVALTEAGVALPGSSTPLPDASPLLNVLEEQGIEIRYLAAEETPDGVIAPGVEVRVAHAIPGTPEGGVAVYRFGRATASATGAIGTLAGSGAEIDAGAVPPVPVPTSGTNTPDTPLAGTVRTPATPTAAPPPTAASRPTASTPVQPPQPVSAATPQWAKSWTMAFYLVIVLSGLVAVSGGQLIRLFAVRMPWTS